MLTKIHKNSTPFSFQNSVFFLIFNEVNKWAMQHTFDTDWTRQEFKAYLLLYAANSNYFESEAEKETIISMVDPLTYKRIHRELDQDNDYQSIQKILHNIESHNYSKEYLDVLINDIQTVFNADNQHDILEENMLMALKKLLRN